MFQYKHVLLIGATAGIGRAMADRLIEAGVKVTAVGRRQDRLDEFIQKHGPDKAGGVAFDIGKREEIPTFAERIITSHPDVDCVFMNAGIQNPFDLTDQAKFDLEKFDYEVNVNFSSFVAIVHAFLPFLKQKESCFIFTGSNLAIIPAAALPAYSASKAALNAFTLCLREQLKPTTVKVIEISPPPVQSELHDYMGSHGRNLGMPMEQFINQAWDGLTSAKDQIVIGAVGPADAFNEIIDKRRAAFENLAAMMRK